MKSTLQLYASHKKRWLGCADCLLHEHRSKVVLCRGKLPCDVLFLGEAPGESEDTVGSPFVGPAGQLLDQIVGRALGGLELGTDENDSPVSVRTAFTNLIACIPHNEDGNKYEVPKEALKACRPRLVELCLIACPKLVVQVGTLAASHWRAKEWESLVGDERVPKFIKIDHPAYILRSGISDRGLLIQRCEAVLGDAVADTFT